MGMSNYLRNKMIDHVHRGKSFTPPTSHWVALTTTTPNAGTAGTECTGTGYARQEVIQSTTHMSATNGDATTTDPSTGTSGISSNNDAVNFGTAGSSWGTATYWETYDAVTGGNRLMFGPLVDSGGTPTPRTISTSDPVNFPVSALRMAWV